MSIDVGRPAPDFELSNQFGAPVRLSSFQGEKNVVLVFFPKAFTPKCTAELCEIRDESSVFETEDTVVLGISCDSDAVLKVFAETEKLEYQLLSDFWPHGAVCSDYGVFIESRGFAMRATFVIDKAGIVRWSVVNSPADPRSAADYREALASL
jgi:peroxiredoxin